MKKTADGIFKTAASVRAAKSDATTTAAREIIDKEVADRNAKTERLRAARLAQEGGEAVSAAAKPAKKARKPAARALAR